MSSEEIQSDITGEGGSGGNVTPVQDSELEESRTHPKSKTKKKTTKKKGKGSEMSSIRSAYSRDDIRTIGRCSNCANLLTQTRKLNTQQVTGIAEELEKRVSVYLCDDCQALLDGGSTLVTLKTAVYKNKDGNITNVPLTDLIRV